MENSNLLNNNNNNNNERSNSSRYVNNDEYDTDDNDSFGIKSLEFDDISTRAVFEFEFDNDNDEYIYSNNLRQMRSRNSSFSDVSFEKRSYYYNNNNNSNTSTSNTNKKFKSDQRKNLLLINNNLPPITLNEKMKLLKFDFNTIESSLN